MDAKKIADEILEQLFPSNADLQEATDEDEVDDDGDEDYEDDDGDEGDEPEVQSSSPVASKSSGGSNSAKNQNSVAMKPSGASSEMNAGAVGGSSGDVRDAHGGSATSFDGKQAFMVIKPTEVNSQANAATLQMKPSFAGVQMPALQSAQMQEEMKTLFGADVSEDFLKQATSLYEASINTNLQAITEEMSNLYEEKLAESIVEISEALESTVNQYLGYVVEEWVKENALAIETGLRTEIAENFIHGLKNLFTESYIEVPEDKTNVFDEMTSAIETLESRVNEEMQKNVSLREKVSLLEAQSIFQEETSSMKTLDAENLRKLAENVEFSSSEDFRSKVSLLVENYSKIKSGQKSINKPAVVAQPDNTKNIIGNVIDTLMEETDSNPEQVFISDSIKMYSDVLGRTIQG